MFIKKQTNFSGFIADLERIKKVYENLVEIEKRWTA
jgi:hypothetical protein